MDKKEIKIVVIGESGSGKSTMIRHLAQEPEKLKFASSTDAKSGTTKSNVEYTFGRFEEICISDVSCELSNIKSNNRFSKFLEQFDDLNNLERDSEAYFFRINSYAKDYLSNLTLDNLFKEINSSKAFNIIKIDVPANDSLFEIMEKNDINLFRVVDTRGLGDEDDIERVIPIVGADAIMVATKKENPSPVIREGIEKMCKQYSHIPLLFVGKHLFDADEIYINPDTASIEDYITALNKFNRSNNTLKVLYVNTLNLVRLAHVEKAMKECFTNNIPYLNSLAVKGSSSRYEKYYIPACINTFSNCIESIHNYDLAQSKAEELLKNANFKHSEIYKELASRDVLDKLSTLIIEPRYDNKYRDYRTIATYSYDSDTRYSYNCVSVGLRTMIKSAIDSLNLSNDNNLSDDLIKFILNRLLEKMSRSWNWGWDYYYKAFKIDCLFDILKNCEIYLQKQQLKLNSVVCTRFKGTSQEQEYDSNDSIIVLLYEHTVKHLLGSILSQRDLDEYLTTLSNN